MNEIDKLKNKIKSEIHRQMDSLTFHLSPDVCNKCGNKTHGPAGCIRTLNDWLISDLLDELVKTAQQK